jgi:hydroxymethylbilane synthase
MNPLRVGTRGSALALWQASFAVEQLRPLAAPRAVEIIEVRTTGDERRDAPLAAIGGEGLFTKEIQRALLENQVDVGVHSLKDLPTMAVDGLILAAVPARGPACDALLSPRHGAFARLPQGARVATSSLRRRAQLLNRRRDLRIEEIRGNVETRVRKLNESQLDALVLAQAGLERLGLESLIGEILPWEWMMPAVGQGALGFECRAADVETSYLLGRLDHVASHRAVLAERAFLRSLGGGCQVPVGAHSTVTGEQLILDGAVLDPAGTERIAGRVEGPIAQPEALGERLARDLLFKGAGQLLAAFRAF